MKTLNAGKDTATQAAIAPLQARIDELNDMLVQANASLPTPATATDGVYAPMLL